MAAAAEAETGAGFVPQPACWVCGSTERRPVHETYFEFEAYRTQDPELADYTGKTMTMVKCSGCGFMQPAALPSLDRYFDRMYDQHWSEDWIEREFDTTMKDVIFRRVLDGLEARLPAGRRRLLDVGAHAGRFLHLASGRGWTAEGIELNPRTAAFAERRTALKVHRENAERLADSGRRFDAITLTDVLEHIPQPLGVLKTLHGLLEPGGWIAVKVPCGPSQLFKENVLCALKPGRKPIVAQNLVHISHFSAGSLALGLRNAGFAQVDMGVGAPEYADRSRPVGFKSRLSDALRSTVFAAARLPGMLGTPLALNLQAFARRD